MTGASSMKCIKGQQQRCLSQRSRLIRLRVIIILAGLWAAVLTGRLYYLQSLDIDDYRTLARNQHIEEIKITSERGMIMDRHGTPVAMSIPAGSVFAHPHQVKNPEYVATRLAPVLDMSEEEIKERLNSTAPFVWIKRKVERPVIKEVEALKLKGIDYLADTLRRYPYGSAGSVLIGSTGTDGYGLSGIEALANAHLSGKDARALVSRDGRGKRYSLPEEGGRGEVPRGKDLKLSLDVNLQVIVDDELRAGREAANSRSAMAVMLDAVTGEILAMSEAPSINFNEEKIASKDQLRNRVIETVFEPGSTMKPLIVAAALEMDLVAPDDIINCESGRFRFGRNTIKDVHGHQRLSVHDIVVRSSNIGMSKIGILMGRDRLYGALKAFGFGEAPALGLPGETAGILRPAVSWANIDVATHSFGQGVAVTGLQMVRAISAIANGGILPPVSLYMDDKPRIVRRIVSESTAEAVREMMESVVMSNYGTGRRARVEGVLVGGKTGTAQKAKEDGRGYAAGKYIASFVGFMDASPAGIDRTLALIVIIDEPDTTSIYGGTLAAPVFQKIMERSLQVLKNREHLRFAGKRDGSSGHLISARITASEKRQRPDML